MKKTFLTIVACIGILITSCESESPLVEIPETSNPVEKDSIAIGGQMSSILVDQSGVNTLSFYSNGDWTITITDTASVKWLSVSALEGLKGQSELELKSEINYGFTDRVAYITIQSGTAEAKIEVLQNAKSGIVDIPIPDADFRAYCLKNFDTNKDGLLSLEEAEAIKTIEYRGVVSLSPYSSDLLGESVQTKQNTKPTSLKGIEYFESLETLRASYVNIIEVDLTRNAQLKIIDLSYNKLTSINLNNLTELTNLDVTGNSLTSIDLSQQRKLTSLICTSNQISQLDLSNNSLLTRLYCAGNVLTDINLSNASKLNTLSASTNKIAKLDLTDCINLSMVYLNKNELTSIDWSKQSQLTHLEINDNLLNKLDLSASPSLIDLECNNNMLTELNLTKASKLKTLKAANNKIATVDLSNCKMVETIDLKNNQLTALDISKNGWLQMIVVEQNSKLKEIVVHKDYILVYIVADRGVALVVAP